MPTLRTLTLAVSLLAIAAPPVIAGPTREAKQHIDRATRHHKAGEFAEALEELVAAYRLDPEPDLLYAIGQVHVKLGRCTQAIGFYERFLATRPPAGPANLARQAIESCKAKPDPEPEPEPKSEPSPEPEAKPEPKSEAKLEPKSEVKLEPKSEPKLDPEPAPTAADVPRGELRPVPWYRDRLGLTLAGAGVVGGVVGAIFYTSARSDIDAAATAGTYRGSEDLRDGAHTKRVYAAIAGGAGALLLGVGLVHIVVFDRGREERVAIVPAASGALVAWSGRF